MSHVPRTVSEESTGVSSSFPQCERDTIRLKHARNQRTVQTINFQGRLCNTKGEVGNIMENSFYVYQGIISVDYLQKGKTITDADHASLLKVEFQ